jgi:hypothetical protein
VARLVCQRADFPVGRHPPRPRAGSHRAETTATLLIRGDFMNETLQAEVLAIHALNRGDGLVQASLGCDWRGNIRLKLGADIFYATLIGLFGQFRKKDRGTLAIEIGF